MWLGGGGVGGSPTAPLTDAQRGTMLFGSDHSDTANWVRLGGKAGDATAGTYEFDVVRTRFVKMHITGNNPVIEDISTIKGRERFVEE